jgi:hypothetical protein
MKNTNDTTNVETRGVLAGAYRGGRASLKVTLTHALRNGDQMALCGKIPAENLVDTYGMSAAEVVAVPTCKTCSRRDTRTTEDRIRQAVAAAEDSKRA